MPPDLIEGVMPAGEVHMLSGVTGAGKSTFGAWLIKRIADGDPVFGRPTRSPTFMGLISTDRGFRGYASLLTRVDLEIPYYAMVDDPTITGKKLRFAARQAKTDRFDIFQECLTKLCKGSPPADSLIVVDLLAYFLGGDLLDYDKVSSYMLDLNQLCTRHKITIFGYAHAVKPKGDKKQQYSRAQDRLGGTAAIGGSTATSMHLAHPAETGESCHMLTWVPRAAAPETHDLVWRDGLLVPWDSSSEPIKRPILEDSYQAYLELLKYFPATGTCISVQDLREQTKSTMRRAWFYRILSRMVAEGYIECVKKGYYKRKGTC